MEDAALVASPGTGAADRSHAFADTTQTVAAQGLVCGVAPTIAGGIADMHADAVPGGTGDLQLDGLSWSVPPCIGESFLNGTVGDFRDIRVDDTHVLDVNPCVDVRARGFRIGDQAA